MYLCALCIWVGHVEQVSEIVRCWYNTGSQKNITWFVKTFQYMLSAWLLRWTDFFAFFVRVASHRLRSALVSALDSTKYVRCKSPAACPHCPPLPRNIVSPNSVLHRHPHVTHISVMPDSWGWVQINIPEHDRKLTFLSVTTYVCTYAHPENRSLIQSLVLMHSAISDTVVLGFNCPQNYIKI